MTSLTWMASLDDVAVRMSWEVYVGEVIKV
jgi:hypothetical protein